MKDLTNWQYLLIAAGLIILTVAACKMRTKKPDKAPKGKSLEEPASYGCE